MSKGRKAPASGYEFGRKRKYRRDVWGIMRKECPVARSSAQILMMPSSEGTEIVECEKRGFLRRNIHAIDANPAIVAHLTRKFPGIMTHGIPVRRVGERLRDSVTLANFDMTSCWGDKLEAELLGASTAVGSPSIVSVTCLRGREQRSAMDEIERYSKGYMPENLYAGHDIRPTHRDIGRARALAYPFVKEGEKFFQTVRWGAYKSGKQTMLWHAFRLIDAVDKAATIIDRVRKGKATEHDLVQKDPFGVGCFGYYCTWARCAHELSKALATLGPMFFQKQWIDLYGALIACSVRLECLDLRQGKSMDDLHQTVIKFAARDFSDIANDELHMRMELWS